MKPVDRKIYLASKSPRRRELLRQIGVDFELLLLRDKLPRGPEVSEAVVEGESAQDYVRRVTREKCEAAHHIMMMRRLPIRPVLSADTTVVLDGRILGKPADFNEAAAMLASLSGRTHEVLTSIVLWHAETMHEATQVSQVVFAELTESQINAYCASQEPYDKAGGYAVQGAAAVFIERMAGSYSGIMGLPLFETAQLMRQAGLQVP